MNINLKTAVAFVLVTMQRFINFISRFHLSLTILILTMITLFSLWPIAELPASARSGQSPAETELRYPSFDLLQSFRIGLDLILNLPNRFH